MRLQKVLCGALSVVFFLFFCQGTRLLWQHQGRDFACNSAGAFGLAVPPALLMMFAVLVLLFFGVQWWKEKVSLLSWAWLLLLAGGLSNLLERLLYGCVTDYIHFWMFPAFNLADILLTAGALGIFWYSWKKK